MAGEAIGRRGERIVTNSSVPVPSSAKLRAAMTVAAVLITLVLGFAAFAKFTGPDPKKQLLTPEQFTLHEKGLLLDHVVATAEVVVIVGLLIFHRRRWAWSLVALMFAGFSGYTLAYLIRGEPCGCFGALWTPPHGLTFGLDTAFAVTGFVLSGVRQRTAVALGGAMLLCMGTGFTYAKLTAPPTSGKAIEQVVAETGIRPEQQLLESEFLADVFADKSSHITYYVFVYDPECHHCQAMLPNIELQKKELDEVEDPVLRVRIVSIPEIEKKLTIPSYVWTPTPTALFIRDGALIMDDKDGKAEPRRVSGTGVPFPKDKAVYDKAFEELNAIIQSGK